MGRIIEYRSSEESRQQIKAGLEEYQRRQFEAEYERMQAACRPPLTAVERQRVQPSLIDKLMPWILVWGGIALLIAVYGILDWIVFSVVPGVL